MPGFTSGAVDLELGGDYPSRLVFNEEGRLDEVSWLNDNGFHRENNLPAMIGYYHDGSLSRLYWNKNAISFRDGDLPSIVWFYPNGVVNREEWFGKFGWHRVSGPALIAYDEKGKAQGCVYSLDGVEVEKDDWLRDSRVIEYYRKLKNHNSGVIVSDVSL